MANTLATEKQAEAIKQRMAEIRTQLPTSADHARQRVRQLTDWRYHMGRNALPILAATIAAGYFIVPTKRRSANTPAVSSSRQHVPQQTASTPTKKGMLSGLVGAVATLALKQATNVAAGHITGLLTQSQTHSQHRESNDRPRASNDQADFTSNISGSGPSNR
jgi:hypothetical protein